VASLNGLGRVLDPRAAINGLFDNVRSMSDDTRIIERHAAHLDAIDERLDHIVELMERMVKAVEEMQESVEPIGRVANRLPGRSKR
jgi:tetrahydromethanopterin S-methyltransferase subunit B